MKNSALASILIGLLVAGLSITSSIAAPQILALVTSDDEVPLNCGDGACTATVSAFCLQPARATPAAGTAYYFADARRVRLIGIDADGTRVALDAGAELRVSSSRGQLAVRIVMPKERLRALGLSAVAMSIEPGVTLLPEAVAGDANPLSESEIAVAVGPLRQAGARVVEGDRSRIGTARWLARLANALPETDALTPPARARFFDRAREPDASRSLSKAELQLARGILDICQVNTENGAYDSVRRCLDVQHDSILWGLNVDYWLAIHYGS